MPTSCMIWPRIATGRHLPSVSYTACRSCVGSGQWSMPPSLSDRPSTVRSRGRPGRPGARASIANSRQYAMPPVWIPPSAARAWTTGVSTSIFMPARVSASTSCASRWAVSILASHDICDHDRRRVRTGGMRIVVTVGSPGAHAAGWRPGAAERSSPTLRRSVHDRAGGGIDARAAGCLPVVVPPPEPLSAMQNSRAAERSEQQRWEGTRTSCAHRPTALHSSPASGGSDDRSEVVPRAAGTAVQDLEKELRRWTSRPIVGVILGAVLILSSPFSWAAVLMAYVDPAVGDDRHRRRPGRDDDVLSRWRKLPQAAEGHPEDPLREEPRDLVEPDQVSSSSSRKSPVATASSPSRT